MSDFNIFDNYSVYKYSFNIFRSVKYIIRQAIKSETLLY